MFQLLPLEKLDLGLVWGVVGVWNPSVKKSLPLIKSLIVIYAHVISKLIDIVFEWI